MSLAFRIILRWKKLNDLTWESMCEELSSPMSVKSSCWSLEQICTMHSNVQIVVLHQKWPPIAGGQEHKTHEGFSSHHVENAKGASPAKTCGADASARKTRVRPGAPIFIDFITRRGSRVRSYESHIGRMFVSSPSSLDGIAGRNRRHSWYQWVTLSRGTTALTKERTITKWKRIRCIVGHP